MICKKCGVEMIVTGVYEPGLGRMHRCGKCGRARFDHDLSRPTLTAREAATASREASPKDNNQRGGW